MCSDNSIEGSIPCNDIIDSANKQRIIKMDCMAVDHDLRNKIQTASCIDTTELGIQEHSVLSRWLEVRKEYAKIMLRSKIESEVEVCKLNIEYCNEQIKSILGL